MNFKSLCNKKKLKDLLQNKPQKNNISSIITKTHEKVQKHSTKPLGPTIHIIPEQTLKVQQRKISHRTKFSNKCTNRKLSLEKS